MKKRVETGPARPPCALALRALVTVLCLSLGAGPAVQAQSQVQTPPQPPSKNARFKGEPVTLNFVNADIEGVARAMSAILKQQFIVDPRVKGNITLYNEEPLAPRAPRRESARRWRPSCRCR